jgi:ABC-type xylose transport system permease subunit
MNDYDTSSQSYILITVILVLLALYNLYMLARYFSWTNLLNLLKQIAFILIGFGCFAGAWWMLIGGHADRETYIYFSASMAFFCSALLGFVKLRKTSKTNDEGSPSP